MKILIKNGRVVDPANNIDKNLDVLVENTKIKEVNKSINAKADITIDASKKIVAPGLIDVHTHLREPGHEEEETIYSGTRAAAHGGVTTIICMPNTHPPIDNAPSVEFITLKAKKEGLVNVYPIGCVTKGSNGREIAEIGILKKAGIVAISDDGNPVINSQVMRHALKYSKMFKLPVVSHCEDLDLSRSGVMNSGKYSTILGLRGIPKQSEEIMVNRDIMLAELTGGYLHIAHISTSGSVELIRRAKQKKINVTAETCPHYFTLTEEDVRGYNTNTKMKPPLRSKEDVIAIKEGIKDGTIDCIATDHAPHTEEEKNTEYDLAPFGIIGLETILGLIVTELIDKNILSWTEAIATMTNKPAGIFSLDSGTLSVGKNADIVIIDPNKEYKIDKSYFISKSKNSPFVGRTLKGMAEYTIVGGKVAWSLKEGIKH